MRKSSSNWIRKYLRDVKGKSRAVGKSRSSVEREWIGEIGFDLVLSHHQPTSTSKSQDQV